jgi:hypothetical protein
MGISLRFKENKTVIPTNPATIDAFLLLKSPRGVEDCPSPPPPFIENDAVLCDEFNLFK